MSDNLVKRLREDQPVTQDMASTMQCALQDAAADRIEELEAELEYWREEADLGWDKAEERRAGLAKATDTLARIVRGDDDAHNWAIWTLAELKGETDE